MNEAVKETNAQVKDKLITPRSGGVVLAVIIMLFLLSILGCILAGITLENHGASPIAVTVLVISIAVACLVAPMLCGGLKIINPNEALVLTLFGKYYGTIGTDGFFFVNPFCTGTNPTATVAVGAVTSKKISLKAMTLNNEKQKVNDQDGNPIEIGVIVIWRVVNAAAAVFNVQNYKTYVSTQCDSAIRHVARSYPYDVSSEGDEQSLRGSSSEIAEVLKNELQSRTGLAGIEILEARISHLAYAPEIAAAMLQRQQASAIIAARKMIVDGAVGMVEMALTKLAENNVVVLDDERKAQMVSNLLVVLCGNKDAQPIVNSGSIY